MGLGGAYLKLLSGAPAEDKVAPIGFAVADGEGNGDESGDADGVVEATGWKRQGRFHGWRRACGRTDRDTGDAETVEKRAIGDTDKRAQRERGGDFFQLLWRVTVNLSTVEIASRCALRFYRSYQNQVTQVNTKFYQSLMNNDI